MSDLLTILPRLLPYIGLFVIIDKWVWGRAEFRWAVPIAYGVARLLLGALLGHLLHTDLFQGMVIHGDVSMRYLQAVLIVILRLLLWSVLLMKAGARSYRLAVGVAGGMFINLATDYLQPKVFLYGLPVYC